MADQELVEIADDLYALPLGEFTAARDARAASLVLTHLPVDGDGSWAHRAASEVFSGAIALAEPGRTYEVGA